MLKLFFISQSHMYVKGNSEKTSFKPRFVKERVKQKTVMMKEVAHIDGQQLPFDYSREIRLQLTPFSHKLDIMFNLRNDELELKLN